MKSDGTKSPLPAMPLNYLPVATGIDGSDDLHVSKHHANESIHGS